MNSIILNIRGLNDSLNRKRKDCTLESSNYQFCVYEGDCSGSIVAQVVCHFML